MIVTYRITITMTTKQYSSIIKWSRNVLIEMIGSSIFQYLIMQIHLGIFCGTLCRQTCWYLCSGFYLCPEFHDEQMDRRMRWNRTKRITREYVKHNKFVKGTKEQLKNKWIIDGCLIIHVLIINECLNVVIPLYKPQITP